MPKRYLILSDIHANWEALEAVLIDSRGRYDEILCCGDLVGYGADPDLVTEWVRQNSKVIIRGNHDKACAGLEDLEWFNPVARISALWTQRSTNPRNIQFLRELPQGPVEVDDFQLVHGSPLDEDEYLISELDASQVLPYLDARLIFFGHTHVQGGFASLDRKDLRKIAGANGRREELILQSGGSFLLNPGSVGQPRDGDPRAAYAVYNPDERKVTYYRVAYDLGATQRKIRGAGLPELLATRLATGQ